MTRARHELIKPGSRGTFHLVTRCVHRSLLLMKGDRRAVLARGLASWLRHMGIDLLGYAIMGNHLHLVVRLRPDLVQGWSEAEVARHALAVLPVRSGPGLEPLRVTSELVERYAGNKTWLKKQRQRLSSPSWLLRLVKQEVARRANAEDEVAGHFWESRFTSVALVDAAAVLACLVYVDLNPLRAGMVRLPEASEFTSIRHRFHRAKHGGNSTRADLNAADAELGRQLLGMRACAPVNEWTSEPETWEINEAAYVDLVEQTGRTVASGKRRSVSAQAPPLIERLGINGHRWHQAMAEGGRMLGSVIGGPEARNAWAAQAGQSWAADKSGLWGKE